MNRYLPALLTASLLLFKPYPSAAGFTYPERKDVSFNGRLTDMQRRFTEYISNTGNAYFMQARQLSVQGMKLNDAMENRKAIICYLKAELLLIKSQSTSPVKDLLLADVLQNKGRTYHYLGRADSKFFCEDSKKLNERLIYNPDTEIARFAYFFLATNFDMLEGIYRHHYNTWNPQIPFNAVKIKRDILRIRGAEMGRSYWNYAVYCPKPANRFRQTDSMIYYCKLALKEFDLDRKLDRIYNGEFMCSNNLMLARRYMEYEMVDSCKHFTEQAIASLTVRRTYKLPRTLPAFLDYEEMVRASRELSDILIYLSSRTSNAAYIEIAKAILDSATGRMKGYTAETFSQGGRNHGEMYEVNKFMVRTLALTGQFPLRDEEALQFVSEQQNARVFNFKKRLTENQIVNLAKSGQGEILNIRKLTAEYEVLETDRTRMPLREYLDKTLSLLNKIDSLEQSSYKREIAKAIDLRSEIGEIRTIPANLHPNTAILFYNYEMAIGVCTVISSGGFVVHKIDNTDQISVAIDSMQRIIALKKTLTAEGCAVFNKVYNLVVRPFINGLHAKDLVIIPSGNLSQVPFEALITSFRKKSDGSVSVKYLIHDYTVRYDYSLQSFYKSKDEAADPEDDYVYAFAPSYEQIARDSGARSSRHIVPEQQALLRSESTPLKYNVLEAQAITKNIRGRAYTRRDATEKKFREVASDADILHLAMHGYSRTDDPMYSGLVFTKENKNIKISSSAVGNDSIFWVNDGILYAHEIYQMHIQADLVVLSACETGIGRFDAGEGTRSLGLAFRYAGSNNCVMSLWKADDENTAQLMKLFYYHLQRGRPKADALAMAKREFIAKDTSGLLSPFYWASFILLGDNEPVYIKESTNYALWFWLVLGGGVICFALLRFMRPSTQSKMPSSQKISR